MAVEQLQDVYSFRKTGLTCHKWKADTTKLKGVGKADDPDEGVGEADDPDEADDPNKGVGEADNPNKGVDEADDPNEADDPDEGVGEADDPNEADDLDEGVGEVTTLTREQAKLTTLTWPCLVSTFAYIKKYLAPHAWC